MILLQTPVHARSEGLTVTHDDNIMLLGSCFSDNIGSRLADAGLRLTSNPFGTLYNPLSISSCLRRSLANEPLRDTDLVCHDGLWHSWLHHSRFSSPDRQQCLDLCNKSVADAHQFLRQTNILVLTFGTAFVFEFGDSVVANCHKVPADKFVRRLATVDEMLAECVAVFENLRAFNPAVKILLTVSPIRHLADGAHGNQVSKSTLHLLCHELQEKHGAYYFPAYEIMMDELRDYRFYADDMLHPSPTAIEILFRRFIETYFPPAELQQIECNLRESRRQHHRPIIAY